MAAVLWLILVLFTDEDDSRLVRTVLIVGLVLSAVIGVVRFVKWAWGG